MSAFKWDHIQYRCLEPDQMAAFFIDLFGAVELGRQVLPGKFSISISLDGLRLFLEQVSSDVLSTPPPPHRGLEHIGLIVSDLEAAAVELRRKGALFWKEPTLTRPGVKIAFVKGPEGVLVELLERSAI